MARPKSSNVSTASTDEEKIEVEAAESKVTEKVDVVKEDAAKTEKPKKINDNDEVVIKCPNFANKSIIVTGNQKIELDSDGKATVKGDVAKRLITIPGFELA